MLPLSQTSAARRAILNGAPIYPDKVINARSIVAKYGARPVYPLLVSPALRLETFYPYEEIHPAFAQWTEHSIVSLAEAGFFLKAKETSTPWNTSTTCYHCGNIISGWQENDDPLEIHSRTSDCDPSNTEKELNKLKIKPLQFKSDPDSERQERHTDIDSNIDSDDSATSSNY